MKFITPLFLTLALSTSAHAYDGLDVLDGAVAAADEMPRVLEENSAGWIFEILVDIAEATGPNIEAMQSDDPDVLTETLDLIDLATAQPIHIVSHTRPHHDGITLAVIASGYGQNGNFGAELAVEVANDDGTVTSFTVRVVTDFERIAAIPGDEAWNRV